MAKSSSRSGSSQDAEGPQVSRLVQDLVRLRRKAGLTSSEVARRMGISRQQVYGIETGRGGDPSSRTMERYAKAIGVRILVRER